MTENTSSDVKIHRPSKKDSAEHDVTENAKDANTDAVNADPSHNADSDQLDEKQADESQTDENNKKEVGGRAGPEPTRYGDWEKNGRCVDF